MSLRIIMRVEHQACLIFDAGNGKKGALVNAVRKGDPVSLVNSMLKYQNDFSQKKSGLY